MDKVKCHILWHTVLGIWKNDYIQIFIFYLFLFSVWSPSVWEKELSKTGNPELGWFWGLELVLRKCSSTCLWCYRASVFTAELPAFLQGLRWMEDAKLKMTVICSDSIAALQAINQGLTEHTPRNNDVSKQDVQNWMQCSCRFPCILGWGGTRRQTKLQRN